jgi:hypothetical protein
LLPLVIFGYVDYHQFYLGVLGLHMLLVFFGLLVVAALNVLAGAGVLLYVGQPS